MPGTVIGKSLNLGFIGNVSRNPWNVIVARTVKSILSGETETLSVIPFGKPTVLNVDGTVSLWGDTGVGVSAATAANFAGIAVAEVKQGTVYGSGQAGGYEPARKADALQFGSCTVKLNETLALGDIDAGTSVFIVDDAGTSVNVVVGDFVNSATPDGDSTAVEIPGLKFKTGKVDANNVVEVTFTERINV